MVTNAGCNGKFLAVLDLEVESAGVTDFRYRLLPVFSNLLPPIQAMQALIEARCARRSRPDCEETLAGAEGLLYRRGNFNGTLRPGDPRCTDGGEGCGDRVLAGFRWGTTILPGQAITLEHLMDQTAITYPYVTLNELSGADIKAIPGRRLRQPVQPRSLPAAGRRHGARGGALSKLTPAIPRRDQGVPSFG